MTLIGSSCPTVRKYHRRIHSRTQAESLLQHCHALKAAGQDRSSHNKSHHRSNSWAVRDLDSRPLAARAFFPTAAAPPASAAAQQLQQLQQPASGGQGSSPTDRPAVWPILCPPPPLKQPTAPAQAQPLPQQQTHPATGGQGTTTAAAVPAATVQPGGISAGPPQPLQQPTAPTPAQPLPQKQTHPTATATQAGSSEAQPQGLQQPQPDIDWTNDDDDDSDAHDPAAEESDWTEEQIEAWNRDVAIWRELMAGSVSGAQR